VAVWDARINALNQLHAGEMHSAGYGFAISSNKNLGLVLCKGETLLNMSNRVTNDGVVAVLTVYSKGGGKGGKHGWVASVPSITAASNIVIQVYQHQGFGGKFFDTPMSMHAFPQLHCFDIIPSSAFLCVLHAAPSTVERGLQISAHDYEIFKDLNSKREKIATAMKAFKKRPRANNGNDSDDEVAEGFD
jgi:hypothetical protein